MTKEQLAQDMATWANLVIQELRIDTPRGNWDILDKLEDAVAAFTAAVEPKADSTPLERVFSESPTTPIVEQALKRIADYDDETSRQLWTEDADGKPRCDPV